MKASAKSKFKKDLLKIRQLIDVEDPIFDIVLKQRNKLHFKIEAKMSVMMQCLGFKLEKLN